VRLDSVSLDLSDEVALVLRTGLEPAVALKHALHRTHGEARKSWLKRGKIRARGRLAGLELRISLVGGVAVQGDGVVLGEDRFPGRQGRLLFAYLVLEQARPVPRDELAEVLWGEDPPATWDKALTVLASKLRALLTELGSGGAITLTGAFGCYRLGLPEGTWVDVLAAASAAQEAERALAADDLERAKAAAMRSASLAREPFLPGEEGSWVAERRRELADVRSRALGCLADASLGLGDASAAARWAEEAIALEPFRETGYRRLMEAHSAAGNRAEALRVYERCRRLLAEELGAYPSPETETIYRRLLQASPSKGRAVVPEGRSVSVLGSEPDDAASQQRRPERRQPKTPTYAAPAHRRQRLSVFHIYRARRRPGILIAIAAALLLATAIAVLVVEFSGGGSAGLSSARGNSVAAIDPRTNRLVADIPVGNAPTGIAVDEGAVWVTNAEDGTVSRVDPELGSVIQTTAVGSGPSGIAVANGAVWVVNGLDGTVSRISTETSQVVQTIPVGNGPSGIAVGEGAVWIVNQDDHTLSRIDPRSGNVVQTFGAGTGPVDVAVGAGALWVTNEPAGTVSRVDPTTRKVIDTVNVGRSPGVIVFGAGAVWVANGLDGTVSRIDPETSTVTATIEVGDGPVGISAGAGSVWVSSEPDGSIWRIDPASGDVQSSIATGSRPAGIASGPGTVFVAVRPVGRAHRGGMLRLTEIREAYVSIDPALAYETHAQTILSLTNDGLTAFKRVGGSEGSQLVPDLATSLPAPTDARGPYTFRLRSGLRYATGQPLRPADFRRALERVFQLRSPGSFLYTAVLGADECMRRPARCNLSKGVVADERAHTVTFRLTEPDPDFSAKLALPFAFAVPAGAAVRAGPTRPLPATGPYAIASYVPARQLRLVRNPRFREWSPAARPDGYPDEIVIRLGVPESAALRAVARSVADVGVIGQRRDVMALRRRYASRVHVSVGSGVAHLYLNTRIPPFDDLRVRRALNYAVDRGVLAARAPGPTARPTCQVLPPNFPGYRLYCPYRLDPARAARLVSTSGTSGAVIVILTPAIAEHLVSPVVTALRRLGYRARLRVVEDSTYDPLASPASVQAGFIAWVPDYPSAAGVIPPLFSCRSVAAGTNPSRFCARGVDRMINRALNLQATDQRAANELWGRVDRMIVDQAPLVPMVTLQDAYLVSARVGNYQRHPLWGLLLDQLWVR
jgi:YVTN family beta-propeller protein